jgi:amino acid adenylation domain-containing protein
MKTDAYPLSAMQQSMILSTIKLPGGGIYLLQYVGYLGESLQEANFRLAWARAIQRHAVLRCAFSWQDNGELIQEEHEQVAIPWQVEDWSSQSKEEQKKRLETFLKGDRRSGFDLNSAPLLRIALFRQAEASYVFVLTLHHAILDGRSVTRLISEVFEDYQALGLGRNLNLPTPLPFREHILALQNMDLSAAERFWRGELGDFTASTLLGIENPHASDQPDELFGYEDIRLDRESTNRLKNLARQNSVTLNTVVQGAWAILLSRYSNSEDVLFGAVRACRHSPAGGSVDIFGMLINTIPLRVEVQGSALLLPWLRKLRTRWIAMRRYETTPLVLVKQWSGVHRGMPLFESVLNFEYDSITSRLRNLGGAWEHRNIIQLQRSDIPLDLNVYAESELFFRLLYDCRRFNTNDIQRILGHLVTLLKSMIENPARSLGELPILTESENHKLLVDWNQNEKEYPQDVFIHQLFEGQVERTPNGVAVVYEDEQLTYQELNRRANRVAYRLRSLGVRGDTLVGLCLDRSLEMLVGLLGILKAGGAYLPLDPVAPDARLKLLIEDANLGIVLTTLKYHSRLQNNGPRILILNQDEWSEFPAEPNPISASTGENLANVLYTSGTNGKPKGVLVEHRQLIHYVRAAVDQYGMANPGSFAMLQPLTVDSCQTMIFPALGWGGTLHLISRERTLDATALSEYLQNHPIDYLKIAPSHLQALMSKVDPRTLMPQRCLIIGGETSHWGLIDQLLALAPSCTIWNHYGPTETTVGVLTYPVSSEWKIHRDISATVPLGKPLQNVQIYILDRGTRPTPIGVPGELYVGGSLVTRGYLNRPELTDVKYIPDPFRGIPGSRLYQTGDLARFLFDGTVEFLGRSDDQIKLRGYRIEPGEIEAVLGSHPGVDGCLVLVHQQTEAGNPQLLAYVVAKLGHHPSSEELISYARTQLPEVMVPTAVVMLSAMPRTEHGKIDRSALPLPKPDQFGGRSVYVAPTTSEEKAIAAIWSEVLGFDQVGIHDDFFDLGGHSLLAMQIVSRIQRALGVEVSVGKLFELYTVAMLAAFIAEKQGK